VTESDAFAEEAARFERWARSGIGHDAPAVREALIRITWLYASALALPAPWSDELGTEVADLVQDDEWKSVLQAASRLPVDNYGEVFDPLVMPPEEPVVGSVADDIADIYRDVVNGLRLDQLGKRPEAVWQWGFSLHNHWGEHATSAIRALHCWLAREAPEQLTGSG
jgi:hypothetical protein